MSNVELVSRYKISVPLFPSNGGLNLHLFEKSKFLRISFYLKLFWKINNMEGGNSVFADLSFLPQPPLLLISVATANMSIAELSRQLFLLFAN